jgi:hypothetical protein
LSFTAEEPQSRGSKADVLLGCGNGTSWQTFPNAGTGYAPALPEDIFSVVEVVPQDPNDTNPIFVSKWHIGPRVGGSTLDSSIRYIDVALPCGRGNFIYIYGFTSVWSAWEAQANYAAVGVYARTAPEQDPPDYPFLAYRDPTTGALVDSIPDKLYFYSDPDFTGYRGKERRFAAYFCNNRSMRQVDIPAALQAFLDIACPEAVESTRQVFVEYEQSFTHDIYVIPNLPAPSFNNYSGLKVTKFTPQGPDVLDCVPYTPDVFRLINQYAQFTDPATVKSIPTTLKASLADRRAGAWAAFSDPEALPEYPWVADFYRNGQPFYYALWPYRNQEPDWASYPSPKRVAKATLKLHPDRVARNGANDPNNIYGPSAYTTEELIAVWDWNDPAYCRRMCKALGFQDEDLIP